MVVSRTLLRRSHEEIKRVIDKFDNSDAACISKAKDALQERKNIASLSFIKAHFADFPATIEHLEGASLPLNEAMNIIEAVSNKKIPGVVGGVVSSKLSKVLKRNPGYAKMKDVAAVLQGEDITEELPCGLKAVASIEVRTSDFMCGANLFSLQKCVEGK